MHLALHVSLLFSALRLQRVGQHGVQADSHLLPAVFFVLHLVSDQKGTETAG